ncbi:MAG TPA: glycosyltransferase [Niastella sp.]
MFDNKLSACFNGGLAAYVRKISSVSGIVRSLRAFKPDVLYIRSMAYFPGLTRIASSFPAIVEYNTLMEREIRIASSSRARFVHNLGYRKFNRSVSGFIGVTDEITDYYRDAYGHPALTIGNGFDLDSYPIASIPRFSPQPRPQIVFVGSPDQPWHGVDKFYELSACLPDMDFHLIGPTYQAAVEANSKNFIEHGFMDKAALTELYSKMDIAVGSLAMHRNGLNEATPLKVREYGAFGLPMILAYRDTDLSGREFVLEIDNTEDTITKNIDRIRTFIADWKNRRVEREKVAPLIDYKHKEKRRLDFMMQIANAGSPG